MNPLEFEMFQLKGLFLTRRLVATSQTGTLDKHTVEFMTQEALSLK